MIKNKEYYQIDGEIMADFGTTVTNPIVKIAVSSIGVESSGLLNCEYNIYSSAEAYEGGKYFFKAEKDDKRLINFTYEVAGVPNWGIQSYKEDQCKIIADTFGLELDKVTLVEEEENE
tara:strand:- start:759 stop:1112 length:354 start_codon:yes stop_codon:yes gene_type:complete